MKIELIHPPHPAAIEDRMDAPLGLLYVASSLKQAGHGVSVNDLSGVEQKDWKIGEADIYGIASYIPTMEISAELARMAKKKNPQARVVGGGANFTDLVSAGKQQYIPREFDSIVIGSGELAILDFVADFPHVKQYYKQSLPKSLDRLPNPDYSMVDIFSYQRLIGNMKAVSMLTSRGCPFQCAFCTVRKQFKGIRYRSPEAVIEEIKHIIEVYGIRSFNFQDDTFTINKRRVRNLLEQMRPLGINFRCHGRAGHDSKEDYVLLKEAGCTQLCWGIESGSQCILDKMNKKVVADQNQEVIEWAQELGMLDRGFFIIGFPGETWETLEKTKRFIEKVNLSQIFVSSFQPYPGTDVWRDPAKYGVTKIYQDFHRYIQVDGDGTIGRCNIDTLWMNREEMEQADGEFRRWALLRKRRGSLQEYEKRLETQRERNEH